MPETDFNISDEDENDTELDEGQETAKLKGEELDEGDEATEGDEGEETEEETADEKAARHKAARGDIVEEDDEEIDEDALAALANSRDAMIPRARFDKVYRQNQEYAEALAKIPGVLAQLGLAGNKGSGDGGETATEKAAREQAEALAKFDPKAVRKEANKALLDGDEDKAAELMEQVDTYNRIVSENRAYERIRAETAREATSQVVAAAFEAYPFLDDSNKELYDEETLDDVLMYAKRYEEKGDSRALAVHKAVQKVCPPIAEELGLTKKGKRVVADEDDETDDDPDNEAGQVAVKKKPVATVVGKNKLQELRQQRAKQALVRAIRTDKSQAPNLGRAGSGNRARLEDPDNLDIEHMTDEQFDEVPEEVKKRARGDYLETETVKRPVKRK